MQRDGNTEVYGSLNRGSQENESLFKSVHLAIGSILEPMQKKAPDSKNLTPQMKNI